MPAIPAVINAVPRLILGSPLHRLLSGRYAVLEFRGRRTGRRYAVPVAYRSDRSDPTRLWISTDSGWWVNLTGGREFTLRLRGRRRPATAHRITGGAAVDALRELVSVPGYARAAGLPTAGGVVPEHALHTAAAERTVLEVAVTR